MTGSPRLNGIGAALLALAAAAPAAAQGIHPPPPSISAPTRQYVSDGPLTQLFTTLCIKAFPDAAAIDAALKANSEAPMTPEQAKPYLPDGPGRGWLVRTADSLFAVTVEDAPNQTCAVQQMTPNGVRDVVSLTTAIKAHVAPTKGTIVVVAPQSATTDEGPQVRYWGYGVLTADDVPIEQFGVYVTDFMGKAPEPWTSFAGKGSGVQVRFTRTILAG